MGSELQAKYQKLAQEYAKLRAHVDVLKKAVRDEKTQRLSLEESLRDKTQSLRKSIQENESLEFRNHQLSKRVSLLQNDLSSPTRNRKRKGGAEEMPPDIHHQELAAKIAENEKLHMKILELTQRSERTIADLHQKVTKLDSEVSHHTATMDELERDCASQVEALETEKAMLEAKLTNQGTELDIARKNLEREQERAVDIQSSSASAHTTAGRSEPLLPEMCHPSFAALNVLVVDTKLQSAVWQALRGGLDLVSGLTTQLSTFHSYLEQRCKTYPVDTESGLNMSVVNQKLCELLHSSSVYTRPLVSTFSRCCNQTRHSYAHASSSDLVEFAAAYHSFIGYLETLTPYLVLSLQDECKESVCGAQLTASNVSCCEALPRLTGTFSCIHGYLTILTIGGGAGVPSSSLGSCLDRLDSALTHLHHVITELCKYFTSKVTFEYQLPTANQKLTTTNECVISSLMGMTTTTQQLTEFLTDNKDVFSSSLATPVAEAKSNMLASAAQHLRVRATDYMQKLQRACPESVPYTLSVYNTRTHSSSSENRETLQRQVLSNQEKLSRLEQEKEHLTLDLQLLTVKYEKEQKKVSRLEIEVAQGGTHTSTLRVDQPSLTASKTSLSSNLAKTLSESVGSLAAVSAEEEYDDEALREELIRSHFTSRIAELSLQLQQTDGKAAHFYAECRALHKQLNHSAGVRSKLSEELQAAQDTVRDLQDQLATTASNYEHQLSTMSDHLCELNDRLLKQSDELESRKRPTKGRKWGSKQ